VTVICDSAGRYFASFVVETVGDESLPATHADVGIDLGLTHFAVLSDGKVIGSQRFLRKAERRLARAQRSLSRKEKGSNNRYKARLRLARMHAGVRDARRDFHHKTSTAIIRENQAVYVEDLAVAGLVRTRLGKSVSDAGWSSFVRMLEYKAQLYGREFHKVGRFEPTSQLCSACGIKDGPKPLGVRVWTCRVCGELHDRDLNAAKNILALGRRERENACGEDVRPTGKAADLVEAGTHRGAA
jgi:putative transposase